MLMLKDGILIETNRLRFRPWADSDAEALFKYAFDPDVGPRAGWLPHQSIEESLKVIREIFSNGHTWALELKETGEVNWLSQPYLGDERPVKVMRLDYAL